MARQDIIRIAASQDKYQEDPPNSNKTKYGVWYGKDGVKWCAIFVSWVYYEAGYPLEAINGPHGYASCNSGYRFWKKNNCFTKDPQPGDIVLYDWHGDGVCDHTGIFLEWLDAAHTKFNAWEGNTSGKNDSDGGHVQMRQRNIASVAAFVTPLALRGEASARVPEDENLRTGEINARVAQLQRQLHTLGYAIVIDGEFGPATEQVVRQYQQDNALNINGIVDSILAAMIEEQAAGQRHTSSQMTTGVYIEAGDIGRPVVMLQEALNVQGATPQLTADGFFGDATQRALKSFQQQNSLAVDGIAGQKTFMALGINDI